VGKVWGGGGTITALQSTTTKIKKSVWGGILNRTSGRKAESSELGGRFEHNQWKLCPNFIEERGGSLVWKVGEKGLGQ